MSALEARLNYRFNDPALLEQALTHRSAAPRHNERLEFLGDGVLNFIVAAALFERCPDAPEGDLSRLRAALVCERALASIAQELALETLVVLGPGEQTDGSRRRPSIQADTVEAVLGAIYLDSGFDTVRGVVHRLYASRLDNLPDAASLKDAKTRLQEWLQARSRALPAYEVVEVTGAQHSQTFVTCCRLEDSGETTEGRGRGRRKAEQAAARQMLRQLGVMEGQPQ